MAVIDLRTEVRAAVPVVEEDGDLNLRDLRGEPRHLCQTGARGEQAEERSLGQDRLPGGRRTSRGQVSPSSQPDGASGQPVRIFGLCA